MFTELIIVIFAKGKEETSSSKASLKLHFHSKYVTVSEGIATAWLIINIIPQQ